MVDGKPHVAGTLKLRQSRIWLLLVRNLENKRIQFLSPGMLVLYRFYWRHGKDTAKPLLSARSCHPRPVKMGLVTSLFNAIKKRSRAHFVFAAAFSFSQLKMPVIRTSLCVRFWKGSS